MANERRSRGTAWRILVVDDVAIESWACVAALETVTDDRYDVKTETSPLVALEIAREWRPDLVILDIEMPEMDGYELAKRLKAEGCDASRLFLTKLDDDEDQVESLKLAEDYISKPFKALVFLARVRNILDRRPRPNAAIGQAPRHVQPAVDVENLRVTLPNGHVKQLTRNEQKAMRALMRAPGEVVSYAELARAVWMDTSHEAGVTLNQKLYSGGLSQMMHRLREKIETDPSHPRRILNVERVGYRYNPHADEPDGPDGSDASD